MVSNISTTVSFVTMLISMYTGIDGLSLEYFDRSISLRSIFFTSSTVDLLMTEHDTTLPAYMGVCPKLNEST